ncbi:MAG: tRNA preQ1(34) S-adenosylmethionine ribosyltransferase-isomerase QueA [Candidatus Omnitrophica bacterium]|nr:tRNA preQ1(34) S-adenosylmethionine ribosyltransferase-isomerase QueA [Candidatus Omnitrophota bacterium]
MKLNEFSYDLPSELIAQYPLQNREDAKLLIIDRQTQTLRHDIFKNIDQYIPSPTLIILNNSRVVHARLLGEKESTQGKVEVFLLNKCRDDYHYEVLMKPMKRLKNGDVIRFGKEKISAEIVDRDQKIVRFNQKNIDHYLEKNGHIPLPPYIKRSDEAIDRTHYQTVYAQESGSVAAPTAGLHFSQPLLDKLKKAGNQIEEVTLHINYGTFKPVEENDISKHHMHTEQYQVNKSVYQSLVKAKKSEIPVVAVGTTSARVIESLAQDKPLTGETDIFIYPGIKFKWVDMLLTNFHLPYSTLLMLVYAFGGTELMKKAYAEAIKNKYRFYSYGDAMLII